MSFVQTHSVSVTVDASGDAIEYSDNVNGLLSQIVYVKSDFADGVDFTITAEKTGETLWSETNVNASAVRAPRQATHATDGTASLYAATGEPVEAKIAVDGRIKIVVASGGNATSGIFHFLTV